MQWLPPRRVLSGSITLLCRLMSLQAWLEDKEAIKEIGAMAINPRLLIMASLLIAVGCKAQDVRETSQLRRNLRKLIAAELDNPNSVLNSSLADRYVKTLQELNIYHFQKNRYSVNTTVHLLVVPQCDVGISESFTINIVCIVKCCRH